MPGIPAANACRLRFSVFELDLRTRELRKSGMRVRLSGQPLLVLEVLVRRPGDIVTRDELRHELWAGDTFVDFEQNLNSAVKRLRAALGDSADVPTFIETIPRRGYRFLVPVEVLDPLLPPAPPAPGELEAVPPASRSHRRLLPWVAFSAALTLLAGAFMWQAMRSETPAPGPDRIRSLAVLPFANLSNDPDQEYFADGMTDALISSLAQTTSLKVISRTSVMSYRNADRPIPEIARALSVDAIVEGSVLRAGEEVRITAQLIHGATDRHLWAGTYDGRLSDVLRLQSDVARGIANEVHASLSRPDQPRPAAVSPPDPAVHELYLRGRHLLAKRTEPDLRRALEYFQEAAARDPDFALAYAGIAEAWDALASWPGYVPPRDGYPNARAAAMKALALDPSLAQAHTMLASVHELHEWDISAAERRYRQAIALNPNYALAHHRYGQFLGRTRRPKEALEAALRAHELDPMAIETNVGLSARLLAVGRTKEALARMLAAVELDRNYFDSHVHLADIYERLGSVKEAIAAAERGIQLSGRNPHAVHALASLYLRQGNRARARPLIAELEAQSGRNNPYDLAALYLQMANADRALVWLRHACERRTPAMAFLKTAQTGRLFDPVRGDPRFAAIVECADTPLER